MAMLRFRNPAYLVPKGKAVLVLRILIVRIKRHNFFKKHQTQ